MIPAISIDLIRFRELPGLELPVFRADSDGYSLFYAPGCLCLVGAGDAQRFAALIAMSDAPERDLPDAPANAWAGRLRDHAREALAGAGWLRAEPFKPECLTLYINNECNLGCIYCHTDPGHTPGLRITPETAAAAGRLVADSCRSTGRTFSIVFHGGGEPLLHQDLAENILSRLEEIAVTRRVEVFRYAATNGAMSEAEARWAASRFDKIGLSCDGPADIHDRLRPLWNGKTSLGLVERTAHVLREQGCRYHVRTTVTAEHVGRQAEIVDYICHRLQPPEIHLEPVYVGGRSQGGFTAAAEGATAFVDGFLEAQAVARSHGVSLRTSGSRLETIHGPYCNVFRRVLNLLPGGSATACFKVTREEQAAAMGAIVGRPNPATGAFEIDAGRLDELRRVLGVSPSRCRTCFNRFHCVGDCPDRCPLDGSPPDGTAGFRCLFQQRLATGLLAYKANGLRAQLLPARDVAQDALGAQVDDERFPVAGTTDF